MWNEKGACGARWLGGIGVKRRTRRREGADCREEKQRQRKSTTGGYLVGVGEGSAGAEGDVEDDPEYEHEDPGDREGDGVGEHGGEEGAHFDVFDVALGKNDDDGEVGHEWGDDVGDGVTDAVSGLDEFGAEAHHHHHGNEDRGHEGPFGGGAADEHVHDGGDGDECDEQGDSGEADVCEGFGAAHGGDGAEV